MIAWANTVGESACTHPHSEIKVSLIMAIPHLSQVGISTERDPDSHSRTDLISIGVQFLLTRSGMRRRRRKTQEDYIHLTLMQLVANSNTNCACSKSAIVIRHNILSSYAAQETNANCVLKIGNVKILSILFFKGGHSTYNQIQS